MKAYVDLADLDEDRRIEIIGTTIMQQDGKVIGVCVDAEPKDKADRYVRKLQAKFPEVKLIDISNGPVPGVKLLRFGK